MNDRDPEYQVDQAIHAAYQAMAALDRLRMRNDTADFMLREYDQIAGIRTMADDIANDIHDSVYKRAAE